MSTERLGQRHMNRAMSDYPLWFGEFFYFHHTPFGPLAAWSSFSAAPLAENEYALLPVLFSSAIRVTMSEGLPWDFPSWNAVAMQGVPAPISK